MFTTMKEGTPEDWAHIAHEHGRHQASTAPRQIMDNLRRLEEIEVGFGVSQLHHSLQAGTQARRDGASDEEVVAALCHDIGKLFSIPYYEHLGKDAGARDRFRAEPWFALAERLVDDWDAPAFDPDFKVDPLESFEPEITRVFSRPKKMV